MKVRHFASLLAIFLASTATARDYVVVIDPSLPPDAIDGFLDALDDLARATLAPDDSLSAYTAGLSPTLLAQVNVTETNRNRRARQLGETIAAISDALPEDPATTPLPLQLPQLLDEIMGQGLAATNRDTRQVCVLGLCRQTGPDLYNGLDARRACDDRMVPRCGRIGGNRPATCSGSYCR